MFAACINQSFLCILFLLFRYLLQIFQIKKIIQTLNKMSIIVRFRFTLLFTRLKKLKKKYFRLIKVIFRVKRPSTNIRLLCSSGFMFLHRPLAERKIKKKGKKDIIEP